MSSIPHWSVGMLAGKDSTDVYLSCDLLRGLGAGSLRLSYRHWQAMRRHRTYRGFVVKHLLVG